MTCCARRVGFDTLHSQPVEGHRSPTMAYTVRRHRLSSITRAPLPQGDRRARPALAGGALSGECNRIVLDAGDVFDDAFAVRCPSINAEGKSRGHLRPLLPQSSSLRASPPVPPGSSS